MPPRAKPALWPVALILILACTDGSPGAPSTRDDPGDGAGKPLHEPGDGSPDPGGEVPPAFAVTTRARLWLLTPTQYGNVLQDAFGFPVDVSSLAVLDKYEGFLNPAKGGLQSDAVFLERLEEFVLALVEREGHRLHARLYCEVSQLDRTCLAPFVRDLARIVLRQADGQYEAYLSLFETLRTQVDTARALQGVVAAMLLSPKALYRSEAGDPLRETPGPVPLTPSELAESLAFTLWNRPPDRELMDLAANGQLANRAVLQTQIDRMLRHENGKAGLKEFLVQWLGIATLAGVDKNTALHPMWSPALRDDLQRETLQFVDHILRNRLSDLSQLLGARESFITTPRLAALYGLTEAVVSASDPVGLPVGQRMGVFTHPSVIAAMSEASLTGVIYRGKVMLQRLLCVDLSPPPDAEFPDLDDLMLPGDATTRERLSTVEDVSPCKSCHVVLHPFAFAMENYDAIGKFRPAEQGRLIDASGVLALANDRSLSFKNATELLQGLSAAPEVHDCFARQVFRFVWGRSETAADSGAIKDLATALVQDRLNMMTLVREISLSESFAWRLRP